MMGLLTVGAAATAVLAMSHLPTPLVLPALSAASCICAGGLAVIAWLSSAKRAADRVSLWDITGALTLIGCAAALLSEPEQALPLFEQSANRR